MRIRIRRRIIIMIRFWLVILVAIVVLLSQGKNSIECKIRGSNKKKERDMFHDFFYGYVFLSGGGIS